MPANLRVFHSQHIFLIREPASSSFCSRGSSTCSARKNNSVFVSLVLIGVVNYLVVFVEDRFFLLERLHFSLLFTKSVVVGTRFRFLARTVSDPVRIEMNVSFIIGLASSLFSRMGFVGPFVYRFEWLFDGEMDSRYEIEPSANNRPNLILEDEKYIIFTILQPFKCQMKM